MASSSFNQIPTGGEGGGSVQAVVFAGVTGNMAPAVNGVFKRTEEVVNDNSGVRPERLVRTRVLCYIPYFPFRA